MSCLCQPGLVPWRFEYINSSRDCNLEKSILPCAVTHNWKIRFVTLFFIPLAIQMTSNQAKCQEPLRRIILRVLLQTICKWRILVHKIMMWLTFRKNVVQRISQRWHETHYLKQEKIESLNHHQPVQHYRAGALLPAYITQRAKFMGPT